MVNIYMKQLTNKDYKKILKFYKKKIPKTRKNIKKKAKKLLIKKFCSCIKKVQKKIKSKKKYSSIGICTKSVINGKGFKRGKFKCKKKRSIKLYKGGKRRKKTRKKGGGKKKKKRAADADGDGDGSGRDPKKTSSTRKKKQRKITDYSMKHIDDNVCSVCLENLVGRLKTYCDSKPSGHQYHAECYQMLIDKNIQKCPNCRGNPNEKTKNLLREQHGDSSYYDRLVSDSEEDLEDQDFDCVYCGNIQQGPSGSGPDGWLLDQDGQWICSECINNHWTCCNCDIVGPDRTDIFRTDVMQYDGPEDEQNAYASAFGMQNRWGRWNDTSEHFSLNYSDSPQSLCPECNYKAKWEDCGRFLKYELGLDVIDNKECLKRRRTRRWQVVMEGKTEEQVENERQQREEEEGRWTNPAWYHMTCPKCNPLIWEDDPENDDMYGNPVQMLTNGKGQHAQLIHVWHGGFGFRDDAWQRRLAMYNNMNSTGSQISGPDPNQGGVTESKE